MAEDGRDAHVVRRVGAPRSPRRSSVFDQAPAQQRSMRMGLPYGLVPVDLPADVVVALWRSKIAEQERAGEAERIERLLHEVWCPRGGEHVFVRYEPLRTDKPSWTRLRAP